MSALGFSSGGVVEGGTSQLTAFANGGTIQGGTSNLIPVKGYATGGPIVKGPHVALIGEGQHNEAVVPLPDGKTIPVSMSGGGGGTTVNIQAWDSVDVMRVLSQHRRLLGDINVDQLNRRSVRSAYQRVSA